VKRALITIAIIFLQVCVNNISKAQVYYKGEESVFVGKQLFYFIDSTNKMPFNLVKDQNFKPVQSDIPNYGVANLTYWFKINITNQSSIRDLALEIKNSSITYANLYSINDKGSEEVQYSGEAVPFSKKYLHDQNPLFPITVRPDSSKQFFLQVRSINPLLLPIAIGNRNEVIINMTHDQYISGIYFGIILVMFFYNCFLFFGVKDKNYLYYVLYILCVGFTQACLKGYAQKLLWPEKTYDYLHVANYATALSGIFSVIFVINFLKLKLYSPKLRKILLTIVGLYAIPVIANYFNQFAVVQTSLQFIAAIGAILILITGLIVLNKGYKPALFFTISWSFFIVGVIIYIFKDAGIFPRNTFTDNSILFGSSIEVALLSFALADKINIYKKEKEASQAEALRISQENEQLIKQQNVVLEEKVHERTIDLENANQKLSKTLSDLQEAQLQLVEAEKMASLGQLTAGIAHEINNPINFVKSNIKPLQLDLKDLLEIIDNYDELHNSKGNHLDQKLAEISKLKEELDIDFLKTEINNLIKGIEEGAERTAEIVRSLRTFSRLDEGELKEANVHDGLNSTLVLLKNSIPHHIKIIKNYYADGEIECYAGKLNQVFMNIINNGVQAILAKKNQEETESITITTQDIDDNIEISIKDSGIGMTEEVKQKIYDPFFTTKDVGEGTGLGMSIVFKIIEKHSGKIKINSSPGNGAEFILTLPRMQSTVLS
jgi:signal transduction histidine kinase